MNVITTFHEKQREKQIEYEQKVLRELSFGKLEKEAEFHFSEYLPQALGYQVALGEVCMDYAVEAYLLGASYSRFGYYGETMDQIRVRSHEAETALTNDLFDYWTYWSNADEFLLESIYLASETYISNWWMQGYKQGEKRYRLRLH